MTHTTQSRRQLLVSLASTMACGYSLACSRISLAQPASPGSPAPLPMRINLGTLAPRGSSFHQAMQRMAEQWKSQNVRLVIYPDGAQGSEADMVRLMRVGTLQGGLLTAVGLTEIEPAVAGLQSYPLLFRSFDELQFVIDKLRPMLAQRLAAKGFIVLFWADAGWIRYFFKDPVTTPEQFKHVKTFVWSGSTEQYKLLRELGYDPVQMETADILQGLATGQITGVSVPAIFALVSQFEKRVPHMIDLDWAPLVGACVVRKDNWDRLSEAQRSALQAAADTAATEIRARNRNESDQAVVRMQAGGLVVHKLTTTERAAWQSAAEQIYPRIRGRLVPADMHDEVMRLLQAYRAGTSA
jgi:TRAP-type C4-dicarboxylate transport system substrate-binding protein